MDGSGGTVIDKAELHRRIREEIDYIRCPKCGNSLAKFLAKNEEDEVKNSTIARLLMVSEDEVEKIYNDAVRMLRAGMKD
jgi:uncharacterized protein with PIN domain